MQQQQTAVSVEELREEVIRLARDLLDRGTHPMVIELALALEFDGSEPGSEAEMYQRGLAALRRLEQALEGRIAPRRREEA